MNWVLIAGEYPPTSGGVADYTAGLAEHLSISGDRVHVIAPRSNGEPVHTGNVTLHPLPNKYNISSVLSLNAILNRIPRPRLLFVQYVAQSYGWHAMNIAFCLWLHACRNKETIWTMFHEVAVPWSWKNRIRINVLAGVTGMMARLVIRSSSRLFVSTTSWTPWLVSLGACFEDISWLPIPSNLPVSPDAHLVMCARLALQRDSSDVVIGHFGTYSAHTLPVLAPLLRLLLERYPNRRIALLGRRGESFAADWLAANPNFYAQLIAPGFLPPAETAAYLAACDVVIQPYIDGVNTRRTTVMASLALGLPVVANRGPVSEPIWRDNSVVALTDTADPREMVDAVNCLLKDRDRREQLGRRARALYHSHFSMERMIEKLRVAQEMSTNVV